MNTYALILILFSPNHIADTSITLNVENKAVCDADLNTIGTELKKSNTPYKAFCIPTSTTK